MKSIATCWSLLAVLGACGPTQPPADGGSEGSTMTGNGIVRVVVESEDTITDGIAAQTGGSGEGFTDGWSLVFTRFWVNIGHVTLADQQGARIDVPAAATGDRVFDLRAAAATELFTVTGVEARRYDRVSYRTAVVDANTVFPTSVTADATERAMMMGHSVWIMATATKPGRTQVSIDWRFDRGYEYAECEGPADRPGNGIVVAQGGTTNLALSIHGDHWFWQTFAAEGPNRFDAIANADTNTMTMMGPYRGNGDGFTTLAELDMVNLVDVPPADGTFSPAGRPITTLGDYMRLTTGTLGHIDGDGVCPVSRPLP